MFTRRRFLQGSAALGAGLLVPRSLLRGSLRTGALSPVDPATLTRFDVPLPIPPLWSGSDLAANGLHMASSSHVFHPALGPSSTFGYGGASYLGPVIEVRRGEPVSYTAYNDLGPHPLGIDTTLHGPDIAQDALSPRVSVHAHGGYTAPQFDGYPEDTFVPGQTHPYTYPNDQQAGSTWFHDHALGITRLNVYAGLAGLYWIRDDVEDALGLPAPYGVYEIPIILQDKSFLVGEGGANPLAYPDPWSPEFFGDVAVLNGAAWPYLDVDRGWYRLRFANGSGSRFYNLDLAPSLPMLLIGTDSGLIASPVRVPKGIVLGPGERADVLVNFGARRAPDVFRLVNRPLPSHVVSPEEVAIDELMEFRVRTQAGFAWTAPATLRPVTPLPVNVPQRNLLLTEVMDPVTEEPAMSLLNARSWESELIEHPVVNTVEQWNLINLTADTHPIHLHLVQFQLRNRQRFDAEQYLLDVFGTAELELGENGEFPDFTGPIPSVDGYVKGGAAQPARYERGWKDTIQAHPGMVTRILVPFGPDAAPGVPFGSPGQTPFTGQYVWHCHILDHEDNEMMLPYEVVAS